MTSEEERLRLIEEQADIIRKSGKQIADLMMENMILRRRIERLEKLVSRPTISHDGSGVAPDQ